MTAIIRTQDFVGVCLLMSEGKIEIKLADLIRRVEAFQDEQNRHFGITRSDFMSLFFRLQVFSFASGISFENFLAQTTLKDVLKEILQYESAYFNDEGECWDKPCEHDHFYIRHIFDCSDEEYKSGLLKKQAMVDFFSDAAQASNVDLVKKFMVKLGITSDLLYRCSRSGDSS